MLPFLRLHLPIAHIRIDARLGLQKFLFVGKTAEKRRQEGGIFLLQLLRHIMCCEIVVGNNCHGLSTPDNIGNDIQDRLCLSRPRRALNNADFGGKCPFYRQFLALVQAERIDDRLRHPRRFDFFLRRKIACQHGILADLLDLVVLHAQNVDAVFSHKTDCRGSLFEVLKGFLVFTVCQAILPELHFAPTERQIFLSAADNAIIRAKIEKLIHSADGLPISRDDHLRGIDFLLQWQNLNITALKVVCLIGCTGIDDLAPPVMKPERSHRVRLVFPLYDN